MAKEGQESQMKEKKKSGVALAIRFFSMFLPSKCRYPYFSTVDTIKLIQRIEMSRKYYQKAISKSPKAAKMERPIKKKKSVLAAQ
jgi:hypothetical protein